MRSLILIFELRSSMLVQESDGLLERDFALFSRLLEKSVYDRIYFYSYDPKDVEFLQSCHDQGRLPRELELVPVPKFAASKLGSIVYSLIGPLIHHKIFRNAEAVHTFQVSGAWTGIVSKYLFRKPLLFRCGYPLSVRFKQEAKPLNYRLARIVEWLLMHTADHVGVTSRAMQQYYGAMNPKVQITFMPNYVDLSAFSPVKSYDRNHPILFVGRLVEVKNIENLIIACSRLGIALHIYGKGPMEGHLRQCARDCGAKVTFKGVIANNQLARRHHDYSFCVTCSIREGLPKSVVEALASGLILIGTKTDGVLELVEDGKTGYLIDGYDADAIERRLGWVLENFSPQVGQAAAEFVKRFYSLDHAVEITREVLRQIERAD